MDSLHWGKYSNAKVINFDVGYGEYYGKNKDIERAIIKAISKVKKATDIQLTRYFLTEGIVQAYQDANIKLSKMVLHVTPEDYKVHLSVLMASPTLSTSMQQLLRKYQSNSLMMVIYLTYT